MKITAKAFPYTTKTVSKEQFDAHVKLYKGYVDKTNEISQKLETDETDRATANATYSVWRGLKKGETYAIDGVILHELYFENMCSHKGAPLTGMQEVIRIYGGMEKFNADMTAAAMAARGWVVFAFEQRTQSYRILMQDSHDDGVVMMAYPLVALDMYEHAYFYDYLTDKAAYIKAFLDYIKWDEVEKRVNRLIMR